MDIVEKPAAPCNVCVPLRLGVPLNFPAGRIETCPECAAPAGPKGVYSDNAGDHLHFECYGMVVREGEQDGRKYVERVHHHFDHNFTVKTIGA